MKVVVAFYILLWDKVGKNLKERKIRKCVASELLLLWLLWLNELIVSTVTHDVFLRYVLPFYILNLS